MRIKSVTASQIYDSRGFPTVEAEVCLENDVCGRGIAPSGASTGQFEAWELRDGDQTRFRGKSVFKAIANIQNKIAPLLRGCDVEDQSGIDRKLIELDGTVNKSNLGANAILPVSLAVADAAAKAGGKPLYEYLGRGGGTLLPIPEIQIIGGGAHANWRTDVQDFLLIATGARNLPEALEITHNVYHAAGDLLRRRNKFFGVADEGGYWPEFESNTEALELIVEAIQAAGYTPGEDAAIALDIAASDLFNEQTGRYHFRLDEREFASAELVQVMADWCQRFPIVSIEDPLADTDWEGWRELTSLLGRKIQLVGDDLFATNVERIRKGIAAGISNAVLIKLNQIGTVTETLEAIRLTQSAGWRPIVSARSGDTEEAFISHLAVATNCGQLKVGSFARSERMAKWNELIRIERSLAGRALFAGFQRRVKSS